MTPVARPSRPSPSTPPTSPSSPPSTPPAPLTGEVLIAVSGGDVAAAMSLDTGAVIADPFEPTAHLVELLRTAARPAPRQRPRAARRAALRAVRAA